MNLKLFFIFLAESLDDQLKSLWKSFTDGIQHIWEGVYNALSDGFNNSIGKFFEGLGKFLESLFSPLTNWFQGAGRAVSAAWDKFVIMAGGDPTVATIIIILVPIAAVLIWKFKGALI